MDRVLLLLIGLLALSLLLYATGILPYPFGTLVLLMFIFARFLSRGRGS